MKNVSEITNEMAQEELFLIPTMGSLHEGHLSLIESAKRSELKTIVSIFVNPKQFNDVNDYKKYPRDISKDIDILERSDVDYLFNPEEDYIYGKNFKKIIHSGNIGNKYEGQSRPGHFDGVLTVVNRLFELVKPKKAIFGKKDAQQLFLIKEYVDKNNLNIDIHEGEIIRDSHGLALSSRNQLLSSEGLSVATGLKDYLESLKQAYLKSGNIVDSINSILKMKKKSELNIDYLHILDKETFSNITENTKNIIIIIAGFVEGIRLIDNIDFEVEA